MTHRSFGTSQAVKYGLLYKTIVKETIPAEKHPRISHLGAPIEFVLVLHRSAKKRTDKTVSSSHLPSSQGQ